MAELDPRPTRLRLPKGYGAEKTKGPPGRELPWSQVSHWLETAHNYWVVTTRADKQPHAKPVWGVWLDDRFYFSTSPETVTALNLRANSAAVVHLDSGDKVAILQGAARPITERELPPQVLLLYESKYRWPLEPANPMTPLFVMRPRIVLSWIEGDSFPSSATRWLFK